MKIALLGYGKMGKKIESLASLMGGEVVVKIDSQSTEKDWEEVQKVDVCIDFSHPEAILENIKKAASYQKPIVVGTTGWKTHLSEVKTLVEKNKIGLIYAANFSIGMNLFMHMVAQASKLLDSYSNYDVSLSETHHQGKVDKPSGTAYLIGDEVLKNMTRKKTLKTDSTNIEVDEIAIYSERIGNVFGTHSLCFNSHEDQITLTHKAHDRSSWAIGALKAASWIQDKKGVYTISDMLKDEKPLVNSI